MLANLGREYNAIFRFLGVRELPGLVGTSKEQSRVGEYSDSGLTNASLAIMWDVYGPQRPQLHELLGEAPEEWEAWYRRKGLLVRDGEQPLRINMREVRELDACERAKRNITPWGEAIAQPVSGVRESISAQLKRFQIAVGYPAKPSLTPKRYQIDWRPRCCTLHNDHVMSGTHAWADCFH